jgi:hypothetical protein
MKNLFWLILLVGLNSYTQESRLIASCCAGERGRCSGTASCTACTNCSGCKHCAKEGGTCGVCSGYSSPAKKKSTSGGNSTYSYGNGSSNTNHNDNYSNKNHVTSSYSQNETDQYIHVTSETLNVRAGAGSDFEIVAKLKKGTVLQFIKPKATGY